MGAIEAIIGISVGAVLALVLIVGLVVYCCRRRQNRAAAAAADAADHHEAGLGFKIQTLGRQYKLASIPNAEFRGSIFGKRFSFEGEIDEETAIKSTAEASRKFSASSSKTGYSRQNSIDEVDGGPPAKLNGHALVASAVSTYLDEGSSSDEDGHMSPAAAASCSRRSSHTSQHQTMEQVERASRLLLKDAKKQKSAPLAVAESMGSAIEINSATTASRLVESPSRNKSSNHGGPPPERPQSDAQVLDRVGSNKEKRSTGAFIPKLPPKKKRILTHKSAVNMTGDDRPLLPAKRASAAASSRSENCLLLSVAEDLDYDDLPAEEHAPVVPPKTKPKLPPKQKIDKSQDDLARIESQFQSSVSELRTRMQDEDYDDLPEVDHRSAVGRTQSAGAAAMASSAVEQGGRGHEYEDYDDPISHSSAVGREYEDYDEPIQHSRA